MYTPTPWTIGPTSNPHNGTDWRDLLAKNYNGDDMYIGEALKHDAAFIVRAVNAHEAMREALSSLRNEVAGMVGIAEDEIRRTIGHTNIQCLIRKLDEANKALALAEEKEQR